LAGVNLDLGVNRSMIRVSTRSDCALPRRQKTKDVYRLIRTHDNMPSQPTLMQTRLNDIATCLTGAAGTFEVLAENLENICLDAI
jgi:hypothetical protein